MANSSKNLKKLSRSKLLELMIEQSKEIERLNNELVERDNAYVGLLAAYEELDQMYAEKGDIDEEAVRVLMANAGRAAEEITYKSKQEANELLSRARLEADAIVREANEEAAVIRKYAKMLLSDARGEASEVHRSAKNASDELLAETRRKCADLFAQAQAEIDELFDAASSRASGGLR